MFGSQALETLIGLVLMFFILSLAASAVVEAIAQVFRKRARNLEQAIAGMFIGPPNVSELSEDDEKAAGTAGGGTDRKVTRPELRRITKRRSDEALSSFKGTSVYGALQAGSRRARPSYISARAFADAVGEMIDNGRGFLESMDNLPSGLRARLKAATRKPAADITEKALLIRSEVEQWFDDTMARLEGAYKRWVNLWLFIVGLFLAVLVNASAFHVANDLWNQPATREAVVNAAAGVEAVDDRTIQDVARTTEELQQLQLPVGWPTIDRVEGFPNNRDEIRAVWDASWRRIPGWLATALLVMLGAPFWFDLLTKLIALRGVGPKPPPAADDPASATAKVAEGSPAAQRAAARQRGAPPAPPAQGAPPTAPDPPAGQIAAAFGLALPQPAPAEAGDDPARTDHPDPQ
jgi:hypothetical protein